LATIFPLIAWMFSWNNAQKSPNPIIRSLDDQNLHRLLSGLQILVIGGNEEIGAALAQSLQKYGSIVTVTSPSPQVSYEVTHIQANLSTMRGAMDLSNQLRDRTFDTVVFAGGFVFRPLIGRKRGLNEEDLHTSYLSRFILINKFMEDKILNGRRRIYLLGYPGDDKMISQYEDQWFGWPDPTIISPTVNTVLFNDALIYEAAKRFPDVHVFGANPGFLSEGKVEMPQPKMHHSLFSTCVEAMLKWIAKSPEEYVKTTLLPLIASPELSDKTAIAFNDRFEELPMKKWFSQEKNRQRVWENSEFLVEKALG
jgi:hypothetical protein